MKFFASQNPIFEEPRLQEGTPGCSEERFGAAPFLKGGDYETGRDAALINNAHLPQPAACLGWHPARRELCQQL